MKNALIVLDIDQTLIDTINIPSAKILLETKKITRKPSYVDKTSNNAIWERPHLKLFLEYLDKNFTYIGIWTNGTPYWLNLIVKKILTKYIPKKKLLVLYSINKSEVEYVEKNIGEYNFRQAIYLKKLEKIWQNVPKKYNISEKNTLLIDDNFDNCIYNKKNSLPARKYSILSEQNDTNLKNLIYILNEIKNSNNFNNTLDKVYNNITDFKKLFI